MKNIQLEMPEKGEETAVLKTNYGEIHLKFFKEAAPKAVENFITHAKNGYYNGVKFHRVIQDFMIQSGDPLGNGTGGESIWGTPFKDEFSEELRNYRGALSMANRGPGTNGSQFFIVQLETVPDDLIAQMEALKEKGFPEEVTENYKRVGGTPWLDFKHTVFGQVFKGLDVVDNIAKIPVDSASAPLEEVIIEEVAFGLYNE